MLFGAKHITQVAPVTGAVLYQISTRREFAASL
jgi:hypothetical protein